MKLNFSRLPNKVKFSILKLAAKLGHFSDSYPIMLILLCISKITSFELRKKVAQCKTIEDLVEVAFDFKSSLFPILTIQPDQNRWEITQLLKVLKKERPRILLELGSRRGGTLFLFTQIASPDAIIISVDLVSGPIDGPHKWKTPLYNSFVNSNKQKYIVLNMNSHDPQTLIKIKKILADKKIDFLFIDADHSYEGVKRDFESYSQLVKKGGIIAIHDIAPSGWKINKFWTEVKSHYKSIEIIENYEKGNGIGVIYL
jgi:cephalosporin hydroxylase